MSDSMSESDPKSIIRIARENGTEELAEPLNLATRVRELRKGRGMTLEQFWIIWFLQRGY